jgi:hypothetical protein
LRIAAQTYRQSGNDFYPGPLNTGTASITSDRCSDFNQIWKITLNDINEFRYNPANWINPSNTFSTWPAEGNTSIGEAQYLAPFVDTNGDGHYMPTSGDYPSFDQNQTRNIPDMMLYWIYNDKGNIHSESNALPIGLELQAQAFAFTSNDEINNTTFYRTTIINRSNETISDCVFAQWTDPELGNGSDDYVEYDATRNLAICYNGDNDDDGLIGYGLNPPAVGIKFLEGPTSNGTPVGLATFICYNDDNTGLINGNPRNPEHFFNYLNGRWKNGSPMYYGSNGMNGTDTCHYIFPGSTDPLGRPAWTEITAASTPGDRRFVQATAPFELLPGAVNRFSIAAVWARASSGGATGALENLKTASEKAEVVFNNNFIGLFYIGPDAPQIAIKAKDKKLEFSIFKSSQVENFEDSFDIIGQCGNKTVYKFQGYQVFQLKDPSIPSDLYDLDKSRLAAQFDLQDSVTVLINNIYDPELGEYVKKIMVTGKNEGIQHSFTIDKDLFSTTSYQMENMKEYHYVIVAYANAIGCPTSQLQYLVSRKTFAQTNLVLYTAFPHDSTYTGMHDVLNETSQLSIYPNPGTSLLQFQHLPQGADHVTFYTIGGKKYSTETLKSSNTIETGTWNAGIYLYRVEDKNGKMLKTGKWIKL